MSMGWPEFKSLLATERLPTALVDLDALERNTDRLARHLEGHRTGLRIASKSIRHVGLMRRILERGGAAFQGIMCFSVEEAAFLMQEGLDDLLVAYPTLQASALKALSQAVATHAGRVHVVVDCVAHLQALRRAVDEGGGGVGIILELDVSYRPLGDTLHIGARRSPLRTVEDVVALAHAARTLGLEVRGVMAYEAHIAGFPDQNPFQRMMNPVSRGVRALGMPYAARLRSEVVAALASEGFALDIVNGGGTGTVAMTASEAAVTEVTAGSGFFCGHLFDYYRDLDLEPAAYFALEACRRSDEGFVTCQGGGYVASGAPGEDRLPLPWLPKGLKYVGTEGAGEVQTPLDTSKASSAIELGEPVIFRHAKSGELAERFARFLLIREGERIVAREPTYRGQGQCFF